MSDTIRDLLKQQRESGIIPVDVLGHNYSSGANPFPIVPETPYKDRPVTPLTSGPVTYMGQTIMEKYVEVAMAEYIKQFPNDSPAELARKSIQLALETCRQLEIINSMNHGK